MKFKKGRYRFVFVFPSLGIAIKLPFIRLIGIIGRIVSHMIHLRFRLIHREMIVSVYNSGISGYRSYLFGGIITNWEEFMFFRKTKNPFLLPTYFSFFGFFNIQKAGEPCKLKYVDLWCQLYELTNGRVWDSSHHFENPDNFCFDKGKIKIVDYGDGKTHRVIIEYGTKIQESFDPNFDWEEKKKARVAQKT